MKNKNPAFIVMLLTIFMAAPVFSASKEEIDADVKASIAEFYEKSQAGKALAEKASGMLVFPKVSKANETKTSDTRIIIFLRPLSFFRHTLECYFF